MAVHNALVPKQWKEQVCVAGNSKWVTRQRFLSQFCLFVVKMELDDGKGEVKRYNGLKLKSS